MDMIQVRRQLLIAIVALRVDVRHRSRGSNFLMPGEHLIIIKVEGWRALLAVVRLFGAGHRAASDIRCCMIERRSEVGTEVDACLEQVGRVGKAVLQL